MGRRIAVGRTATLVTGLAGLLVLGAGCLSAAVPAEQRDEFAALRHRVGRPVRGELVVHVLAPEAPAVPPSGPDVRAAR